MSIVSDSTLLKIRDEIVKRNNKLRDFGILFANETWDAVQANVRSGHGDMYPVGTELVCHYNYKGTVYDFPWIVVDNTRTYEIDTGITVPGLTLQAKYATIEYMPFDSAEQELATEDYAELGIRYCGVRSNGTYRMLSLNPGDPIPYDDYVWIYRGEINNASVYQYGYGRWAMSAARQWLNSSEDAGNWFTPTHVGDLAPLAAQDYDGFMKGLDDDFLAVVTPVHIKTQRDNYTGNNLVEDTCDKFWLPSLEEMWAIPQHPGVEGEVFPYWRETIGTANPTNATNNARRVKQLDNPTSTSSSLCYLRSAQTSYAQSVWYNLSSSIASNNAMIAIHYQPVCVIC